MKQPKHHSARGFTLIELSIVLVIIGLIIGGILVGRDLIQMAQARSLMTQMEKIQSAISTFRLKYNCKAGDCTNANRFGFVQSGNGDGLLGGITPSNSYSCLRSGATCLTDRISGTPTVLANMRFEIQSFWPHLSVSNLIAEDLAHTPTLNDPLTAEEMYLYFPKDALGKTFLMPFSWGNKMYIRTGGTSLANGKHVNFETTALNAGQMYYIANKLGYGTPVPTSTNGYFDALAAGHRVVALGIDSSDPLRFYTGTTASADFTACIVSDGGGGYKYNIDNGGNCNLMWQMDY